MSAIVSALRRSCEEDSAGPAPGNRARVLDVHRERGARANPDRRIHCHTHVDAGADSHGDAGATDGLTGAHARADRGPHGSADVGAHRGTADARSHAETHVPAEHPALLLEVREPVVTAVFEPGV